MKTNAGHTILELLIVLLITTIVGTLVLKESTIIFKNIKNIESVNKLQDTKNHIASIINQKDLGTWHALENIKISNIESFLNTFTHLQTSTFKPQSEVLSIINYNTDYYLAPLKDSTKLYCLIKLSNTALPAINSLNYLALDRNHWQETKLKLKSKKHPKCISAYEITNYNIYNSSFNNQFVDLTNSILLPVDASYSIYLATDNSLRRLEHSSLNNQPIEYKISSIQFEKNQNRIQTTITRNNSSTKLYSNYQTSQSTLELYAILMDLLK